MLFSKRIDKTRELVKMTIHMGGKNGLCTLPEGLLCIALVAISFFCS